MSVREIARSNTGSACFHCGLQIHDGANRAVMIDGELHGMCCAGCQAVAQTIVDNGLTSYYRHRTSLPDRADSVPRAVRDLAVYDIPEIETELTRVDGEHMRVAALMLEGITCAACVWLIEQRISRLSGVLDFNVNYVTHRAQVRWDARHAQLSAILAAVEALGYRAYPYDATRAELGRGKERDRALWRLFVAGFGMMQVMMYVVPVYLANGEMTPDIEQLMRIASLILTLPVMLYSAAPFFTGAWRDMRAMQPGMDVPVAIGIGAAFTASVIATVTGSGNVYFDSVTMFVFLLLAARYVEMMARTKAVVTQEQLVHQVPAVAERFRDWPASTATTIVPAGCLAAGDYVRVRAGLVVPSDGLLVEGVSQTDERLLNGESRPQAKHVGDRLIGGSFNIGSPFVMRVTHVGSATVLAGIMRLLDRAAMGRPQLARSADRIAQHFVLALLLIAAIVALIWHFIDPAQALWVTVAVLVVSCPCALSLATPAAVAAATGSLHADGVLVTRPDAIENLAKATHYVFDKTGTLTTGQMTLTGVVPLRNSDRAPTRDECLALAARLEAGSSHPIAHALVAAAPVSAGGDMECKYVHGAGVEAALNGTRIRLGSPTFVAALGNFGMPAELDEVSEDVVVVALADEVGWISLFTLADPVRSHARKVIRELIGMGKTIHLLSGDRPQIVAHVARELGISSLLAGATPEQKLAYVEKLQKAGSIVAMIGDGVNDVAGLAAAHVSVAMGSGADVACGNSDVILLSNRLESLLVAVRTARQCLAVIRQNLVWACGYNLLAIPLAACGLVSPLLAGIGMAASSMLVVCNAMRLLRRPSPAVGARLPSLSPVN